MGQAKGQRSAEGALHIPVAVEAKSRNAETVLSMAELDGIKGDKANLERLASAGEALVPVHHGW